ncbi:hypothetical protein SASPL_107740 [Salvia splendens]|uniref:Uncharacterized protein n=1 Tax=Salvia splendens TaxID=180675 RepID=A0A8X9A5Z9_SALSN|nr:hypothetical protein SASPL_107740 [Salvia splendens]
MDPAKLGERVEKKTLKKVEVVTPKTKQGDDKDKAKNVEKKKEDNAEKKRIRHKKKTPMRKSPRTKRYVSR